MVYCFKLQRMGADLVKREIWFRWRWRGMWPGMKIVHWKGYALSLLSLAIVGALAFVSERHFPFLALYWLGALVFVGIYWMLMLDHAEWDAQS